MIKTLKNSSTNDLIAELYNRDDCIIIGNIYTPDHIATICNISVARAQRFFDKISAEEKNGIGTEWAYDDLMFFLQKYKVIKD